MKSTILSLTMLITLLPAAIWADGIPVTIKNYVRAESDVQFKGYAEKAGGHRQDASYARALFRGKPDHNPR
jgi:hypothetical protein